MEFYYDTIIAHVRRRAKTRKGIYGLLPRPVRDEPVSAAFDADEARTYGGLMASEVLDLIGSWIEILAGLTGRRFRATVRKLAGDARAHEWQAAKLYLSVKQSLAGLGAPLKLRAPSRVPRRKPASFKWRVSPAKTYRWAYVARTLGFDMRDTSAFWIERKCAQARAKAAQDARDLRALKLDTPDYWDAADTPKLKRDAGDPVMVRTFEPIRADDLDMIWPPVTVTVPVLDIIEPEPEPEPDGEEAQNPGPVKVPLIAWDGKMCHVHPAAWRVIRSVPARSLISLQSPRASPG